MKSFNKSLVAAGVAAALSFSASAYAEDTAGTTTTSKTYTVSAVFDNECMKGSFSRFAESNSDNWYSYLVASQSSVEGGGSVWEVLRTVVSADVTFDITQHGLNGATNQVDLSADISNVSFNYGELATVVQSENKFAAGVWWEGPVASATAATQAYGIARQFDEVADSVAVSTSVKGANISEFSSEVSFAHLGTKSMGEFILYQAFMEASNKIDWAEGSLFAADLAIAAAEFFNQTSVDIKLQAHYQKAPGANGDETSIVVIDNVETTMQCNGGGGGEGMSFITVTGDGNGGDDDIVIIAL